MPIELLLAIVGICLLLLFAMGVRIAFALGILGLGGLFLLSGGESALIQVPMVAFKTLSVYELAAIPLFVLMSQVLLTGGVGRDLFDVGAKWLGHLPGGLAVAAIAACAIFAAISGSSVATAATIGLVAIPEMSKRGYDRKVILGTLAAGGTLGILIPPSLPMIVIATITDLSVGKLFMAGVVPGLILTFIFMGYIGTLSLRTKLVPREPRAPWGERLAVLKKAVWGVLLPPVVLGTMYTGIVTPTEAAAVGSVYALLICFLIYRSLNARKLLEVLMETMKTTSMVYTIMIGAMLLGHFMTIQQMPQAITSGVGGMLVYPWVIMIIINLMLIVMGMFLEVNSILLITVPIIYPIIQHLGYDPIWFSVVMVINMELALISPPVGLNLFVIQGIGNAKFMEVVRGVLPFGILMVGALALILLVPELSTWLPSRM